MEKITCLNCGSIVVFSPKTKRCSECNCKNYGYNINNLPPIFQNYLSSSPVSNSENVKHNFKNGFLIVHTENKEKISFEISDETIYIGRKDEHSNPHINIENDKYVSRGHANILVQNNNYYLYDDHNNQTGKPSLNGTYINGNPTRVSIDSGVQIFDGDTIQIGETKLVLITPETTKRKQEAISKVNQMNYTKTIIIE